MILVRSIHTFGDGLIIFAKTAVISLIFRRARVGGHFGVQRFFSELGIFFGAGVAGVLIQRFSYAAAFYMAGGCVLAVAVLLMTQRPIFRRIDIGRGGDEELLELPEPPSR